MTIVLVMLMIVAQPMSDVGWVSTDPQSITAFSYVRQWGVEAYLAHDYLAGNTFINLNIGDRFYADGREYVTSDIVILYPTAEEEPRVFERFYGDGGEGDGRLVLQTCVGSGYYFVVADLTGAYKEQYRGMFVREVETPFYTKPPPLKIMPKKFIAI